MTELTTRTLPQIADEIRYLDRQAKRLVLGHAIEIGNRLIEAKELVEHGEWGEWLKEQFDYSQSSANNFMRIAEEYGSSQMGLFGPEANSQTLGNLPYTKALRLLAVPQEEREEFARENDIEGMSTRELEKVIKEREELTEELRRAREDLLNADDALAVARDELAETRDELKALESRPIPVAVEQPGPEELQAAIEKAVKEATAASEKALEAAKKSAESERAALERKLKAAENAAKKAQERAESEEDAAELERLRAEVAAATAVAEKAKKQLAMSDSTVAAFKVHFEACQREFLSAKGLLEQMEPEQREKMTAALRALINKLAEESNG